jgi:hypothetical protein
LTTTALLYLRSRRAGWSAFYLALVSALTAALHFGVQLSDKDHLATDDGSPISMVLVFVPLAAALVIGVGAYGPFGEVERTASRPLSPLRLGHLAGLLLWAAATLFLLALTWDGGAQVFMRNLAGFTGLALISTPLTGARLSWVPPFGYGVLAYWVGMATAEPKLWAWPMRPEDDGWSLAIAIGLLLIGLAAAALVGSRDAIGETE